MCQIDADGMANGADPDQEQSDLGLHCLARPVCLNHYRICSSSKRFLIKMRQTFRLCLFKLQFLKECKEMENKWWLPYGL